MKLLSAIALTASVLWVPASAHAQQGWAPIVTPIEAKTQPLPKLRGPQRKSAANAETVPPSELPRDTAQLPKLPLPFAGQAKPETRSEARPDATPAETAPQPIPVKSDAPAAPQLETALAKGYCTSVGTIAADAKFAWQQKAIGELARELDERIARLQAKTDEYKTWLARRDEFSERATKNLVTIYSRMRPEAAGQQLTAMDEETAAALLMKLDARVASAILNDMNPQQAARLTTIISGAGKINPPPGAKPAAPERPKS